MIWEFNKLNIYIEDNIIQTFTIDSSTSYIPSVGDCIDLFGLNNYRQVVSRYFNFNNKTIDITLGKIVKHGLS